VTNGPKSIHDDGRQSGSTVQHSGGWAIFFLTHPPECVCSFAAPVYCGSGALVVCRFRTSTGRFALPRLADVCALEGARCVGEECLSRLLLIAAPACCGSGALVVCRFRTSCGRFALPRLADVCAVEGARCVGVFWRGLLQVGRCSMLRTRALPVGFLVAVFGRVLCASPCRAWLMFARWRALTASVVSLVASDKSVR